ncbi:HlyC/CorC family transporter [Synechococcus sp. RSCCF101]|uniref:hemolysin family protein n=1 Tax=Synechococcus sp. RSCCF101 TaxID=2511069 RepID=UPI0012461480|nr:hemolysin family protein [Synechococcus sp. RSCCF101]QEY32294.1 HlyC/CorC family transporter [Synechococcus sp. RSCCF101]
MRFVLLLPLVMLVAFFAASEFALIALRPSRVLVLEEEGRPGAGAVRRLQRRLRRGLVASQLGTMLAVLACGWMGPGLAARLDDGRGLLPAWDLAVFLFLVVLVTLLGGLLPKAWVLHRPETAALRLAPLLESVSRSLLPLVAAIEKLGAALLRLAGLPSQWDALVPALSAGELESLIESGGVTGLMPDERNILEGVFSLRDTAVREVMVPRAGMVTLPVDTTFASLMEAVHATRHARFPVIGDSLDDVRGILDLRHLAQPIARGQLQPGTPLIDYLMPVARIQETASLAELLPVIRSGQPMLVVVDEHGGTEGLVTVADLTSEIVGEEEEPEAGEWALHSPEPDTWLAPGDYEIAELNRQLLLDLPEAEGHHTLAGFLLERLQHIPAPGEGLRFQGLRFSIEAMDGPRIARVRILRLASAGGPVAADPDH